MVVNRYQVRVFIKAGNIKKVNNIIKVTIAGRVKSLAFPHLNKCKTKLIASLY